jgi:hypothetical protein
MTTGISDAQRSALAALAPQLDEKTYLAGGVAIALSLRHRMSLDLDLFVAGDVDSDRLAERLAPTVTAFRIIGTSRGTLHAEVSGVPISVLSYRYPLLSPPLTPEGFPVPVASLADLACMKVSAIAGRGAAKDFWDLSELLRTGVAGGDLTTLLDLYRKKFPVEDIGHAVRSLGYFGEADAAPMPRGLTQERWVEIKTDIARRVKAL